MTPRQLIEQLQNNPESVSFDDTMRVIDDYYQFTPTAFDNGHQQNQAGDNNGSCKILAFGKMHGLNVEQTLACFGQVYREDVLGQPDGDSHQNIRNFMQTGWEGVRFEHPPLSPR